MRRLEGLKVEMLATPDQQISLTDPDARSMATSGRGSGVVSYNVQIAVEAEHHLIVMHEVTNDGTDRSQLSHVANETKAALGVEKLDTVADRGYFNSEEIRACEEAGITVTLPKPMWQPLGRATMDDRAGKRLRQGKKRRSCPSTGGTIRFGNQPHRRGLCTAALKLTGPLRGRRRRPWPMLR